MDECDRLWVMDTGIADILGKPKQYAQNALVIFDLKTDQLIRRYSFQTSDVLSTTFFANVVCLSIHCIVRRRLKLNKNRYAIMTFYLFLLFQQFLVVDGRFTQE